MSWLGLFALILPIAGIGLLIRRLRRLGAKHLINPLAKLAPADYLPVSRHINDPEHPEDKDWVHSEPDINAP